MISVPLSQETLLLLGINNFLLSCVYISDKNEVIAIVRCTWLVAAFVAALKHWRDLYSGIVACELATKPQTAPKRLVSRVAAAYLNLLGLHSVPFVRHAKDRGAGWRSVGWMNRSGWTAVCVRVLRRDNGRIPWHKAVSLGSLCSHTGDSLYCSLRVGWQGWSQRWGGSGGWMFVFCTVLAFFLTVVSFGTSYVKHNRRTNYVKTMGGYQT